MNVGMVGLGLMGGAIAGHILRAGHGLSFYTRRPHSAIDLVALGAKRFEDRASLARASDILILVVSDGAAVQEVLFGVGGLAEGLAAGSLVIDHSTIAPSEAQEIGKRLSAQNCSYLDAPVTGGDVGARQGTLTIMVGGEVGAFEAAAPLMRSYSSRAELVGQQGSGQMFKAVNQAMVALTTAAVAEGLALAERAGLDMALLLDVLKGGAAGSWSLENYGPRMIRKDFAPGFTVRHLLKDLGIVLDTARSLELELPAVQAIAARYRELRDCGAGDAGTHSLIQLYESPRAEQACQHGQELGSEGA